MPPLIYITEKSVQKTGVQRCPGSLETSYKKPSSCMATEDHISLFSLENFGVSPARLLPMVKLSYLYRYLGAYTLYWMCRLHLHISGPAWIWHDFLIWQHLPCCCYYKLGKWIPFFPCRYLVCNSDIWITYTIKVYKHTKHYFSPTVPNSGALLDYHH